MALAEMIPKPQIWKSSYLLWHHIICPQFVYTPQCYRKINIKRYGYTSTIGRAESLWVFAPRLPSALLDRYLLRVCGHRSSLEVRYQIETRRMRLHSWDVVRIRYERPIALMFEACPANSVRTIGQVLIVLHSLTRAIATIWDSTELAVWVGSFPMTLKGLLLT